MRNLIPPFIQQQYQQDRFGGKIEAASLFVDISGFTRMTDTLMKHGREGTEVLSDILKHLFTPTVQAIYNYGGFITTYAGDAFTALFVSSGDQHIVSKRALRAALETHQFFTQNNHYQSSLGTFTFGAKIGLGFGETDWGIVGPEMAKTYYFRGQAIDSCAQAEHYAEKGEIWGERFFLAQVEDLLLTPIQDESLFSQIEEVKDFKVSPVAFEAPEFPAEEMVKFTGEKEFYFPEGEFREVVAIFISFEDVPDLEQFMQIIFKLQHRYGGSHPALDFGDKGGKVLLFFGAPIAYENKDERALEFITDLRQEIRFPAHLRAGISKGILYAGFYGAEYQQAFSCLGSATNQSARFMMKAQWGQILTDGSIAKNPRFEFNHLGDFAYKGRLQQIMTYELENKAARKRMSIYTRTSHRSFKNRQGDFFVGREEELDSLDRLLTPLQNAKFGGVVYVDGEAGLGKSQLVQALKQRIFTSRDHASPGTRSFYKWFYMPCDEILKKSLNSVVYFLNEYFYQNEDDTLKDRKTNFEARFNNLFQKTRDSEIKQELKRTRSVLGGLVNLYWQGSLFSQLDAKGRYENSLSAVKTLIKAESARQPIIIELENGHWIDSDTKQFLQMLTRNVENYPFIIISACRYHDDGKQVDFGLQNIPEERIQLNQITKNSARYMVAILADKKSGIRPVPDETLDFIYQRSEGNPFFIEQICLYLQEHGLFDAQLNLTLTSDGGDPAFQIPSTINDVLIARIDRLTAELKEIVKTASVLGQEFAIAILSTMLLKTKFASKADILHYLNAGEEEVIWESISKIHYIFKHALVREAVYEMQLKKQLRALHKLAAESIEELYQSDLRPYYFSLAEHYEKAQMPENAIVYLKKAGKTAQRNYQNQDVIRIYDRLLTYPLSIEEKLKALERKGQALQLIGVWEQAIAEYHLLLTEAEKHRNPVWVAKAANRLGGILAKRGNTQESLSLANKSYEICTQTGNKKELVGALRNLGIVHGMLGEREKSRQYFNNMLAIAKEINDVKAIVSAVFQLREYLLKEGKLLDIFEKYLNIAQEEKDFREMARLLFYMGDIHLLTHNYTEAEKCNRRMYEIVQKTGDKQAMCYAIGDRGIIYADQGRHEEAIACYEEKMVLAYELGDGYNIWEGLHNMSSAYEYLKKYAQARSTLDKAISAAKKHELTRELCVSLLAKVELHLAREQTDEAIDAHAQASQLAQKIGAEELIFHNTLQAAKIHFATGGDDAPDQLLRLLAETLEEDKQADIFYE
ncbi:MAG: tetratricopeptide repeat protein, partial [Chloroflexota bacterium]|nr:tetratricopeptide repeat protein [Chloroflexota bacterium]